MLSQVYQPLKNACHLNSLSVAVSLNEYAPEWGLEIEEIDEDSLEDVSEEIYEENFDEL